MNILIVLLLNKDIVINTNNYNNNSNNNNNKSNNNKSNNHKSNTNIIQIMIVLTDQTIRYAHRERNRCSFRGLASLKRLKRNMGVSEDHCQGYNSTKTCHPHANAIIYNVIHICKYIIYIYIYIYIYMEIQLHYL